MPEATAGKSWHYKDIFSALLTTEGMPPYMQAIAVAIRDHGFERQALSAALRRDGIDDILLLKDDMLDLLLAYLHIILDDHYISEGEYQDFGLLKILFRIQEGDFYQMRYYQIRDILLEQVAKVWADEDIPLSEALLKVNLQDMFALSYDQFLEFEKSISSQRIRRSTEFAPKLRINLQEPTGENIAGTI